MNRWNSGWMAMILVSVAALGEEAGHEGGHEHGGGGRKEMHFHLGSLFPGHSHGEGANCEGCGEKHESDAGRFEFLQHAVWAARARSEDDSLHGLALASEVLYGVTERLKLGAIFEYNYHSHPIAPPVRAQLSF